MSLPISNTATVTMTIHDYRQIEKVVEDLRAQVEVLRGRRPQVEGSEAASDLSAALDAALPIVQFAVGNLNPESTKGWPHKSVEQLGLLIATMYGEFDSDRATLAITLREFAREARDIEGYRQRREDAAHEVLSATVSSTTELQNGDGPAVDDS
jgi:hypothetical protein